MWDVALRERLQAYHAECDGQHNCSGASVFEVATVAKIGTERRCRSPLDCGDNAWLRQSDGHS
jgi:hypothetical protein